MTFEETSNIPHLSNGTTIVSFTEENIVIRAHVPYVSPIIIPKKYPKRDYEEKIKKSYKPPRN